MGKASSKHGIHERYIKNLVENPFGSPEHR
jgi:hypothetical protein